MSLGSTESQHGLRHINGVPVCILTRDYETAALWLRAGLKLGDQELAVARLWANLQGLAEEVVRMCKPQDFKDARGDERLLRILRGSSHRCWSLTLARKYRRMTKSDQERLSETIS